MAKVVANPVPCESCRATGKCTTCDGSGELASGEVCLDCAGGLCMVCAGTGRDLEFTVDGRPVSRMAEYWGFWLQIGLVAIGFGALAYALLYAGNPVGPDMWTLAIPFGGGGLLVVWAVRLQSLRRQTDRLFGDFYAGTETVLDEAMAALEERRKQRGGT